MPDQHKDDDGILMPILYALLASVGVFALVMIFGVAYTYNHPPVRQQDSQVLAQTTVQEGQEPRQDQADSQEPAFSDPEPETAPEPQPESSPDAEASAKPEEAPADATDDPAQTPAPTTSSPAASSGNSGSSGAVGNSGNADNFNSYNNQDQKSTSAAYVLNTSTKKIHYPSCRDVPKIAAKNYATSNSTVAQLVQRGYSTCGHCF